MHKHLKTKWVKALRSGDYKQWSGGDLRVIDDDDKEKFCCLGVLRHLADPKDKRSASMLGSLLNKTHLKVFGLDDDQQRTLATLNDDGKSFKYIATYIEKNL